jgi:glycosyltransferase involved in cell wall biosynthesis
VAALALARERIPELAVLLTGPARGYVRHELDARGIPYRHVVATGRDELARAYRALDAYVVASRQEGGPKAVLESMASGVPLVTTRVGQAVEIVRDGENGWLVDVDDVNGLAAGLARVAAYPAKSLALVRLDGRATAETLSHEALRPRWAALFDGFVSMGAIQ